MNTASRGAYGELLARAWLIKEGFDVFSNESPSGPVDFIAMNRDTGETILCDAKTLHATFLETVLKHGFKRTEAAERLDVKIIGVTHDGACFWCPVRGQDGP